jgi:hypothetical protein
MVQYESDEISILLREKKLLRKLALSERRAPHSITIA